MAPKKSLDIFAKRSKIEPRSKQTKEKDNMACEDGTWVQVHTIRDGESQAQIMKCNGCAAWWVIIYPTRGRNDAFVIDQATDSEDAFRQAIAEKLAAR